MPRAPKACSHPGCPNLVRDGGRKCVELHREAWAKHGSTVDRADTEARRRLKGRILSRAGHRCQVKRMGICRTVATQVDRIDNTGSYTDENCQAACVPCHRWKSSMEGHAARGHHVS